MEAGVLIGLVGDVHVNRDRPREVFDAVRAVMDAPEITFGNLEGVYTDMPHPFPTAVSVLSAPAHNLDAVAEVFDVLSLANNHILDAGHEAMLDTRARLHKHGVRTCGAGECESKAREPAVLERSGLRVGFLAYTSTFPMGCEARENRPGIAPMRAYNVYRERFATLYQPGMIPVVTTVPDEDDLEKLTRDVRHALERADLVVVSFHWGDYTRPFRLTDHERRTAHHCIDQGAHMVVGHHHHAIRGMEWYRGKPIFYGLGHFVFDRPMRMTPTEYMQWALKRDPTASCENDPYSMGPREGWPFLPMHEDTRMTLFAYAVGDASGIDEVGFLPCRLGPDGLVRPLWLGSVESDEVIAYLDQCHSTQGLRSRIIAHKARMLAGHPTLRVIPANS